MKLWKMYHLGGGGAPPHSIYNEDKSAVQFLQWRRVFLIHSVLWVSASPRVFYPTSEFFFDLCQKGFGLIVLCKNVGRSNRKSSQGQIITKKMDVCRWQISWIVGFLLFLSNVIGDFDKRDYLKREHTLVKPYSGYLFFSIVKTYKTLNYVRS